MIEELYTLAKKAVYGPFGPEDSKDASHLIGKSVLWANTEHTLGSYGVLLAISNEIAPYIIKCNIFITEIKCKWIVNDSGQGADLP